MRELMSGNEAIARAAWEAGVRFASGYPGTPSTEILQNLVALKDPPYCEWSPNEKVAFEVAVGAAMTGARAMVTMKHVGLNVAADPLMTLAYVGVDGGFVACVADDPGMHSSQNEQDTRNYARFAKVPLFEPSDSQEAHDFLIEALGLSERFKTPAILRLVTRVSHSRGIVVCGERTVPPVPPGFHKDPPRYVTVPIWTRPMRVKLEAKIGEMRTAAETSPLNRIEWRDRGLGILTSGIAYSYVREAFPDASVLKLGWSWPWPDRLIREFAAGVRRLLIVEELDDLAEEHVKALGIACEGRAFVPGIGELSVDRLLEARAKLEGRTYVPPAAPEVGALPSRPPVLCPGCPHRGVFHALKGVDAIVTGDIGCYSLGTFAPLGRLDSILCMGAGFTMAHGMQKAGETKKVIGMVGDSTFFHSGVTGLMDVVFNRGLATLIVVDNRTTAMTGHQDHPGTGRTLMGEATRAIKIQDVARACGMERVYTVNPYDLDETRRVIKEALACGEPSLIVSEAPCPLCRGGRTGPVRHIDPERCKACGACLRIGCPAIWSGPEDIPAIQENLCNGCGICEQVCKFDALTHEDEKKADGRDFQGY